MLGKTQWVIPEGFIPAAGPFADDRALRSHEAACILNPNRETAHIQLRIFFSDRDPAGPFQISIEPERTMHLRFDELDDPESIPRETDYASVFESDVPVIVQHTRLDARLGSLSLLSTMAYGEDGK
ncbi:sensory rhodopsin transducer [Proteobacteria bacterium 005FR1]|nr:sensory rhodopsin transducer [Proteobacteria bacterium 005FR1]